MPNTAYAVGDTDVELSVRAFDVDGSVSVPYNESGFFYKWRRKGGAMSSAISLATLASESAAHTDNGWIVKESGEHRFDAPDAPFALPAVPFVQFFFYGVAGVEFDVLTIELTGSPPRAAAATDYATSTAVAGVSTLVQDVPTNAELATALSGLSTLNAAGVRSAVGLSSANLDTQLDALPTIAELATALGTADDAVLTAVGAVNTLVQDVPTNAELATALTGMSTLTAAGVRSAIGLSSANLDTQLSAMANAARDAIFARLIEPGLTFLGAMRVKSAMLFGKTVNGGTDTETYKSARNDGTAGKTRVVMEFLEADRVDVNLDVTDEV